MLLKLMRCAGKIVNFPKIKPSGEGLVRAEVRGEEAPNLFSISRFRFAFALGVKATVLVSPACPLAETVAIDLSSRGSVRLHDGRYGFDYPSVRSVPMIAKPDHQDRRLPLCQ